MLRSMKDLEDYAIRASDGNIGHVKDFYFDDDAWGIRYYVIDTGRWAEATVSVELTRQAVQDAPPYAATAQLDRTQEMAIHEHYGCPGYWATEVKCESTQTSESHHAN